MPDSRVFTLAYRLDVNGLVLSLETQRHGLLLFHCFDSLIESATMKCSEILFTVVLRCSIDRLNFLAKLSSQEAADKELHSHKMGLGEGTFFIVQLQISETAQI